MPKITCEIDTDNKTTIFSVDGKKVDLVNWNIGYYEYTGCCYDGYGGRSACVSWTTKGDDGKKDVTTSISFDSDPESSVAALARNMHKNIQKEIKEFSTSAKMSTVLGKLNK